MTGTTRARPPRVGTARGITTAALLAALLAVSAMLTVRIGPVPLTLQVLVVVLVALLLTPWQAALSVGVYLVAGAAGLPVFSGMAGGLGVLAGPTGGYLWGFLLGAVTGAAVRARLVAAGTREAPADAVAAAATLAVVYLAGATQLALVAHLSAWGAVTAGVLPFVLADAVKAAVATSVAVGLRRARTAEARPRD